MRKGIPFGICALLALFLFAMMQGRRPRRGADERLPNILIRCRTVGRAIEIYRMWLGELPRGGSFEITMALRGSNSLHMDFLPGRESWFDKSGRIIDTWGTPLEINVVSNDTIVEVRSAGPNKKAGDKDDANYQIGIR
jgi:hypothetical protein